MHTHPKDKKVTSNGGNLKLSLKKNSGFTLMELLVVIATIGVLAGVMTTVINSDRQQEYAEDAVIRQDLSLVVDVIETYYISERSYPDQGGPIQNPEWGSDSSTLYYYLKDWPAGMVYNMDDTYFSIHVQKATSTDYFKYCSDWKEIRECAASPNIDTTTNCD